MAQSADELLLLLRAEDQISPTMKLVEEAIDDATGGLNNFTAAAQKVDFRSFSGLQRELALAQNKIVDMATVLDTAKEGTLEYASAYHGLTNATAEYINITNQLNAPSDIVQKEVEARREQEEAIRRTNEELKKSIPIQEEENKNLLSTRQNIEYWDKQLKEVQVAIREKTKEIQKSSDQFGYNAEKTRQLRDELKDLQKVESDLSNVTKSARKEQGLLGESFDNIKKKIFEFSALKIGKSLVNMAVEGTMEAIQQMRDMGVAIDGVKMNFDQLAQRGGMDATELRNSLRNASMGMVNDMDLMSSASKAMSLGVGQDIQGMSDMMKIAQVRGAQMGETTQKAYDDLMLGIGRLSPRILDNLGIVVSCEEAYTKYANSIGKSKDALSKQEQQQALLNEVIEQSQQELELRGQQVLSIPQKFQVMKTSIENDAMTLGNALVRYLEPRFDFAIEIFEEVGDTAQDLADRITGISEEWNFMAIECVREVWNSIEEFIGQTASLISTIRDIISETISRIANEFLNLMGILDDGQGNVISFGDVFNAVLIGIQTAAKTCVQIMQQLVNLFTGIKRSGTGLKDLGSNLWSALKNQSLDEAKNAFTTFGNDMQKARSPVVDKMGEDFDSYVLDVTNGIDKIAEAQVKGSKYMKSNFSISDLFGGNNNKTPTGGGSSKKDKSAEEEAKRIKELEKEMVAYAKETQKMKENKIKENDKIFDYYMNKQRKKIEELNKEYEKGLDEIDKKIEKTTDNIEKLQEEIEGLKQKLAQLNSDEKKSIASEFINARKELKKLEEEYQGIGEVASSVSMEDLAGKKGIGKFDIDAIKEYKQYQAELESAYSGLSEQERQAMDQQVAYQEWYQSLNGIEKIKEDYRIKREEVQAELDKKIQALNEEQALKSQYERERQQWQAERMKALEVEVKKFEQIKDLKEAYEKEYMDILAKDQLTQIKYYDDLIQKANELARARERAARAGDGGGSSKRAIGGSVEQGKSYLVGEMGPELFVPNQPGKIVNNKDLGQGGNISVNVNLGGVVVNSGSDEEELAQTITENIIRQLQLYKKGII